MKYIFLIMVLILSGCSGEHDSPAVLLRTDSAFSQMALDSGMHKAFKFFAANEMTKFTFDKILPDSLTAGDSSKAGKTLLCWAPLKANISKDGDLGWTAGTWFYIIDVSGKLDTVKTGHYVTFWEKQEDGSWKYIVDKGNLSPEDFK